MRYALPQSIANEQNMRLACRTRLFSRIFFAFFFLLAFRWIFSCEHFSNQCSTSASNSSLQKMISNCMRNATPSKRVEFIFKPIAVPHSRVFSVLFSIFTFWTHETGEMHRLHWVQTHFGRYAKLRTKTTRQSRQPIQFRLRVSAHVWVNDFICAVISRHDTRAYQN